jgi:N-acetylglucosamine-6-sulfatase
MLGHKAPHSFYMPEPKYQHAFDHVKVEYPRSAFQLDGKPDWIKQRQTTWHGIYGPLFEYRKNYPDTRPEAVEDFARMVRSYMATILSVDDSLGRILKTLEDQGILDDTIIVFCTDNGLLEGEFGMVDKRAMHEPSIRVPLLVRYPGLTPTNRPKAIESMVLHIDMAPSILELCGADPIAKAQGRSWVKLVREGDPDWRKAWVYEYDYEKQFPYTPNIRGIRTERWAYMHYPHGDGSPDRHKAELYDLKADPGELHNLVDDPNHRTTVAELRAEMAARMHDLGIATDRMAIDEGIKQSLPNTKIR